MPLPTLPDALTRLRAFRAAYNLGDHIDESSGLTAADLDTVLDACTRPPEDQVIEQLGDLA